MIYVCTKFKTSHSLAPSNLEENKLSAGHSIVTLESTNKFNLTKSAYFPKIYYHVSLNEVALVSHPSHKFTHCTDCY